MPKDKNYITLDGNSFSLEKEVVNERKVTFNFRYVVLVNKIKTYMSWIVWSTTHIIMTVFLPFIASTCVFYEDDSFGDTKKPLILISNHRHIFDLWNLSYAFPFKILFGKVFPIRVYSSLVFSKENSISRIFKSLGIIKFIYFIYNTIHIPETTSFKDKIAPLVDSIKNGESVLLFPEGRLIPGDTIMEFKKGAVKVHELTKAPILPIALRYEKKFFPFYKVYVSIGKPVSIPEELLKKDFENEFSDARAYLREKVLSLYKKTYNNKS